VPFVLPAHRRKVRWQVVLDTSEARCVKTTHRLMRGGETYDLQARSLVLLRLPKNVESDNGDGESVAAARRARRNGAAASESA
jgi:hypothetical protein